MLADRHLIIGLAALLAAGTALVAPASAQTADAPPQPAAQTAPKKTADAGKTATGKTATGKAETGKAETGKTATAKSAQAKKPATAMFAATIAAPVSPAANTTALARTLAGALAATYSTQPALQAERAKLRATDEGVPQALSGWRPTVIVAVSSPHRSDAFDAARFSIDTLKQSVPMWKREFWEGGSAWSEETSPLLDIPHP